MPFKGATTLRKMIFTRMTFNRNDHQILVSLFCHRLFVFVLYIILHKVILINVVLLNAILLHVVLLNVIPLKRETNWGGSFSTVDLLIKLACFVKNVNNIFNIKRRLFKILNRSEASPSVRLPCTECHFSECCSAKCHSAECHCARLLNEPC